MVTAYQNLRSTMETECRRCIGEAENSLAELDNVRKTALEEHQRKIAEFDANQEKCEEILAGITSVTQWLKQSAKVKTPA